MVNFSKVSKPLNFNYIGCKKKKNKKKKEDIDKVCTSKNSLA